MRNSVLYIIALFMILMGIESSLSESDFDSNEDVIKMFETLYSVDGESIESNFFVDVQVFPNAAPVPFYTYVFIYSDDTVYRFTVSKSLNEKHLLSFTNPLLMLQLDLVSNIEDYSEYFITKMIEQEAIWGDSMWWTYEQRYEFQTSCYGYGQKGYEGDYALPYKNELQYERALSSAISCFETITKRNYDGNIRVVEECRVCDTRVYTNIDDQIMKRGLFWCFYFLDREGTYLFCRIQVNSDLSIDYDLIERFPDKYDIGYMKGIPLLYQKLYLPMLE